MIGFNSPTESASLDVVSRRGFLRAGAMAFGGLGLSSVMQLQAESLKRKTGKSVIMFFLSGGPSHIDMYDLKPGAPSEYRGEFQPIRTNVPGIEICELMPMQAKIADKFAIIRGYQGNNLHSGHEFFCGRPWQESPRVPAPNEAQRPCVGSVASAFADAGNPLPPFVSIRGQHQWERSYYLGQEHEPLRIAENSGTIGAEALKNMSRTETVSKHRVSSRKGLLNALEKTQRRIGRFTESQILNKFQERAFNIISSTAVRDAFDITLEPASIRDRYGLHISSNFQEPGKWLLMARRLVEAGVPVVSICSYSWDTHRTNFTSLRELLPGHDVAIHALVTDLDERGLLNDTIVLVGGEFGRAPRIGDQTPDGRGHWPPAGFMWIAGGNIKTGQVIGETDSKAEAPTNRPYFMSNILTSVYDHLGIDPATTFLDHNGRPQYLLDDREPIAGLT